MESEHDRKAADGDDAVPGLGSDESTPVGDTSEHSNVVDEDLEEQEAGESDAPAR